MQIEAADKNRKEIPRRVRRTLRRGKIESHAACVLPRCRDLSIPATREEQSQAPNVERVAVNYPAASRRAELPLRTLARSNSPSPSPW